MVGADLEICVLNPFFYPFKGGTEKVIYEVYSRLAKRHNITIITSALNDSNRPTVEEIAGMKVVRLRTYREHIPIFPMPFLFFDGLKKTLAQEYADIYHINNRYQFFEDTVNIVKGMDRKLALTIHNSLPENIDRLTDDLGRFYDWLWGRKLMRAVDLITGVSTSAINSTVPKKERYKTHLVLNGVDYRKFRKLDGSNRNVKEVKENLYFDRGINISCNGRLVKQKGQIYLIQAVSDLAKQGYDINLMMIGAGPMKRRLMRSAKLHGIGNRIAMLYGLDDRQLCYHYNASNAFCMPSLYEPSGLALLEAMACEVPSVITNVGGMPEIANDCALYTRPKNHRDIARQIKYAIENPKELSRMAEKGRSNIIKNHDWDKIAKEYERLFLDTIRY